MKRLMGIGLTVIFCFYIVISIYANTNSSPTQNKTEANTSSTESKYHTDWRYWSQGASADKDLRSVGCRVVAQAKLLVESGVASSSVNLFNPDIYFNLARGYGEKYFNNSYNEVSLGQTVIAYGVTQNIVIAMEQVDVTRLTFKEKSDLIMDYLRQGKYVIINILRHQAYIGRDVSLQENKPIVWDSWVSWSYNTASKTELKSSYGAITYICVYTISTQTPQATSQHTQPSTTTLSLKGDSNVTATTARLDASCSYTGARPSSVGVYLGTSAGSMSKRDSDNINHTVNPFNIWYNLTGLLSDTTYYYQFYAVVNGNEIRSSSGTFKTLPDPNRQLPPNVAPENLRVNNVATQSASINESVFSVNIGETVSVTWNAVSNATKYRVEAIYWNGSTWVSDNVFTREVTTTSVDYTNLTARAWGFRVTAGNAAGWSSNNASWYKVSVTQHTTPSPLTAPTLSASRTTITAGETITFSWGRINEATSYDIYVAKDGTMIDLIAGLTGTSYSRTFSEAGTYTVMAYSVNTAGNRGGNTLTITVQNVTPAPGYWTEWQSHNSPPAGTVQTETRYQTRNKVTQVGVTTYGQWSNWSLIFNAQGSDIEVETRDVQQSTFKTVYNYYHYTYMNNGQRWTTYSKNPGGGITTTFATKQTDSPLPFYENHNGYNAFGNRGDFWYRVDNGHSSAPGGAFETTVQTGISIVVEYRWRTVITQPATEIWGQWSDWIYGTPPQSSSNLEVTAQYRYFVR